MQCQGATASCLHVSTQLGSQHVILSLFSLSLLVFLFWDSEGYKGREVKEGEGEGEKWRKRNEKKKERESARGREEERRVQKRETAVVPKTGCKGSNFCFAFFFNTFFTALDAFSYITISITITITATNTEIICSYL